VLDEQTFQQLLLAADLLQQHNDGLLAKSARADYASTLPGSSVPVYAGAPSVVRLTPKAVAHPEPRLGAFSAPCVPLYNLEQAIWFDRRVVLEDRHICGRGRCFDSAAGCDDLSSFTFAWWAGPALGSGPAASAISENKTTRNGCGIASETDCEA
jgi:hypothetical protein